MATKKESSNTRKKIANVSSLILVLFISAAFILEMQLAQIKVSYGLTGLAIVIAFMMTVSIIRNSLNHYKMAFNVPLLLLMFYTFLMLLCKWQSSYYLLMCVAFCLISCLYSNFNRTLAFILVQNIFIGYLIFMGTPVAGQGVPIHTTLISWVICMFSSFAMLVVTRAATISLTKALEQQHSFNDLLNSTESYVAMINERNEITYASKTLSKLANTDEPELVQGRPFIDLFPGKGLKVYAGKLLKEKRNYAEDWEVSLNGQKRYFKAASHSLSGESGNALISMYDMTHLAERDEIAAMKDSMKIGLFFIDSNFVIQDHYSRFLEEMLSQTNLFGKLFTDIIADSVTPSELEAIKDYFIMVIDRTYDQEILEDINPLNELHYVNVETGERKVFQCAFTTVERGHGEIFILVTVYDITVRVELQQRLAEEESRRQEEMQSVFELINVEQDVFSDFSEDMEHEFGTIDKTLKSDMSSHDVLVKVYQSVHAIKSNAVILGLNVFGNKLHALESKIKKLRETEAVPFAEMLNLTMEIEKISKEKDKFQEIINKLQSYGGGGSTGGVKQNVKVLIDSLTKATEKASADMEKIIKFVATDIDAEAVQVGPRRIIKEILMQLVRNSVVHGIEKPDVRTAKGKNEVGIIKLSIKLSEDKKKIEVKQTDDGGGLDYKKIAAKAIQNNLIKKEDADNKDALMKVIFSPGFSTAETEGVHAGRGIGLNLVRDRIKEVNGSMKLRSEPDKGTVFFMSIPIVKA
jgi:two-component system, chemotaxis family, sensor kinase CheA